MTETISQFFDAWGQTDASARKTVYPIRLSDPFTCHAPRSTPDPAGKITQLTGFVGLGVPE